MQPINSLEAQWRTRGIRVEELREVAGALLTEGADADALIDLFALEPDELPWQASPLFERALQQLGGGGMSEAEAVEVLLNDLAQSIEGGEKTPAEAAVAAASLYVRLGHHYVERLGGLYVLDDELGSINREGRSFRGRTLDEIETEIRDHLNQLATE
jgi:hypothetical protein